MLTQAFAFLNTPYIYGGQNFQGVDCSGFVQLVLKSAGMVPPADLTAQGLCDYFWTRQSGQVFGLTPDVDLRGYLVFFGKDTKSISHVAIGLDSWRMIEAGGGDASTKTIEDAAKRNACVRIRPIAGRSDFVVGLRPQYRRFKP